MQGPAPQLGFLAYLRRTDDIYNPIIKRNILSKFHNCLPEAQPCRLTVSSQAKEEKINPLTKHHPNDGFRMGGCISAFLLSFPWKTNFSTNSADVDARL